MRITGQLAWNYRITSFMRSMRPRDYFQETHICIQFVHLACAEEKELREQLGSSWSGEDCDCRAVLDVFHCLSKSIQKVTGLFLKSILDIYPSICFQTFFSCPILSLLLLNSNYSRALPLNSVLQFIEPLFHLSIFSLFFSFNDFFLSCPHMFIHIFLCVSFFVINSTQQIFGLDTVFFRWKISVSPLHPLPP